VYCIDVMLGVQYTRRNQGKHRVEEDRAGGAIGAPGTGDKSELLGISQSC
jgi:hypothetical protein